MRARHPPGDGNGPPTDRGGRCPPRRRPFLSPFGIVAIYVLTGGAWILLSDAALEILTDNHQAFLFLQTAKGWLFIAATGLLLYGLLLRHGVRQRRKDIETNRLNRTLVMLNACNQVLIRAENEADLLREMCEAIIGHGGYPLAWVGLAEADGNRRVRPVAAAGNAAVYLEGIDIRWSESETGRGPTGEAIRTGAPAVCRDLRRDPAYLPWREKAHRCGLRSSIALPLASEGMSLGAFNIYSDIPDAFGGEHVALLSSLADNLAYGIRFLRARSERFRSEAAARRESAFSNALLDSLPGVIYFYDEDRKFLRWNRDFERVTGYSHEEISRMSPLDFFAGADKALLDKKIREVFGKGGSAVEADFVSRDGARTPYYFTGRSIIFDGKPCLVGMGIDISERKRAENALRESEETLRTILETLPVGVWVLDMDGTIREGNAAGRGIWGGAKYVGIDRFGEYKGWWSDTGKRIEPQEWAAARAIRSGESSMGEMIDIECFDGSRKTILNSSVPILGADGAITGAVIVNQDITDLRRVQKELSELARTLEDRVEKRTAEARERAEELEAFSYSVSHDLRAPLRGIDGFSLALLEEYAGSLDETGKRYLDRIRSATQRMGQLIDDLLGLSRVTRKEMNPGLMDLSAAVRSILADLKERDPERAVETVVLENVTAVGDESLLRVALTNLLENAWKFTGGTRRARIEFGAMTGPEGTVYFIRDNGCGFDPAYAGKLFVPFQRLHTLDEFQGTGIGLATVHRIIQRHGGKIRAEGAVDRGATFFFTLGESDPDSGKEREPRP